MLMSHKLNQLFKGNSQLHLGPLYKSWMYPSFPRDLGQPRQNTFGLSTGSLTQNKIFKRTTLYTKC